MPTPQELEQKFWKALKSDMTLMLGLDGVEDGHARPMTAQLEHENRGPIWFFTAKDNVHRAEARAAAATATARSPPSPRRGTTCSRPSMARCASTTTARSSTGCGTAIVAAWFEGGKDDPKLALLRLDPERAEIWGDASSLVAGIKLLLGVDPKKDYKDKVAEVSLR